MRPFPRGLLLLLLIAPAVSADWVPAPITSTWREQGRTGYDGIVWYRATLPLSDEALLAARKNELAILLGPPVYGGYEVYANGRLVGRSRGWESTLAFGFPEVFRVPGRGDEVQLAVKARRVGWASDRDPTSGPVSGVLTLGDYAALTAKTRTAWFGNLRSEIPQLILAALFGCVAINHLLLFARRRRQREHLWFGLLALVFAVNTFASTYWIYEVTVSRAIATRLSDMTGHLAAALAIQFLCTFFARRVSRPLRAYQLSHVAIAVFIAVWPSLRPIIASGTVRWLWLLPLLVIAATIVLQEVRRGDAEARIIAAGGVVMIVIQAAELLRNVLKIPIDYSVAAFGFGAVIVAMAIALSLRFRRVHEELDRLRERLEDEVEQRTRELAIARDDALAGYRAKSEFLANISHEIRTPMNGVIGMAELLSRTPLTSQQRGYLEAIQVSGRSLLTLLNDVLDFSRLESNKLTVEQKPFRVRSVVEECLEIMTPLAEGKGLALSSSVAEGTVEVITGDQHRTRQVLLNLLSNAIKFTAHGRVEVRVASREWRVGEDEARLATRDNRLAEIRFSIVDTGQGMSSDDVGRLFVAFQQLEGSTNRQHGGAGLGLAISKRLTELMGGTISVETVPGQGSTFHFTIVGAPAEVPAPRPVESPRAAAVKPLRILLAEDDAVSRIVILGMLEQLGYHADAVNNGIEVLQSLDRAPYDVILMDVQMPGLDGLQVTRRVRAKGNMLHIIALTAHALSGDRERCIAAGMNDYLSKPVRLSDLQQALFTVTPL